MIFVTPVQRASALLWKCAGLIESAIVASVVLVVLVLLSPPNSPVLGRDEGVFVYIGQRILQGELPYRDIWDHKGPLIYYLNALGLYIGHGSLWGVWLVEALFIAAGLLLLYRSIRQELGAAPAIFGLLTWLAGFAIVMGGNIVEEYALLIVVCSLWLTMHGSHLTALWCGILAGLAFMLRPNEVAAPLLTLSFLLWDEVHTRNRAALSRDLWQSALGFACIAGGFAAYFAWNHALGYVFDSLFLFNAYYVTGGANVLRGLLSGAGYLILPVSLAAAGLVLAPFFPGSSWTESQKKLLCFAVALLVITVPLSLLSGRDYRHYYIPWLLPLSILAAYFCFFVRGSRLGARRAAAVRVVAWCLLLLGTIVSVRMRAVPLLAGGMSRDEQQTIMNLQRVVPVNRELFLWGNETAYAVMADRRLAHPYVYVVPLLAPDYGNHVAAELLLSLEKRRPIIIDTSPTDSDIPSLSEAGPPYGYLASLYAFIHENYRVVGTIEPKKWIVWVPD